MEECLIKVKRYDKDGHFYYNDELTIEVDDEGKIRVKKDD